MIKLITCIQFMGWLYIYGLAGLSDRGNISLSSIVMNAFVTLCIIGALQVMKTAISCKKIKLK